MRTYFEEVDAYREFGREKWDDFAEAFVTLGLTEIFKGHEKLPLSTSMQVARKVLRDTPLLTPNVPTETSQEIILTDGQAQSACRFAQQIFK